MSSISTPFALLACFKQVSRPTNARPLRRYARASPASRVPPGSADFRVVMSRLCTNSLNSSNFHLTSLPNTALCQAQLL